MTLILSLLTEAYVVQVSDRKLTRPDGSLFSASSNKAVLFAGSAVCSYTGLARVDPAQRTPTADWLTKVFSSLECTSLASATEHLTSTATTTFSRLPFTPAVKRTAFVAVGWARPRGENTARPTFVQVSNFHNGLEKPSRTTKARFERHGVFLRRGTAYRLLETGQPVPQRVKSKLRHLLRHIFQRRSGVAEVVAALVRAIRDCAEEPRSSVGRTVLSVVIPLKAVLNGVAMEAFTGPPLDSQVTFQYWKDGEWDGVTHGPNFAGPGLGLTNFESGPLRREPVFHGTISTDGPRVSMTYPCALLQAKEGGLVGNTAGGGCVAVFTDSDMVARFQAVHFPLARTLLIKTPEDFRSVLRAIQHEVRQVYFNPTGAREEEAIVLDIEEILRTPFKAES